MLKITQSVLAAIIAHSEKEFPYESCGYLAQGDELVNFHYELTNLDKSSEHFTMDTKEQFAAIKDMRKKGLKLCAVYHSHPETPARPSGEDIRLAYDPKISYVIISLAGQDAVVKSFHIEKGVVFEEQIQVVEEKESINQDDGEVMTTAKTADIVKDCRGVGCPMNLVYTKVELAKIKPGQVLEIILDDGPPINNVPDSVLREGHKVLDKIQLEDGAWMVHIEKVG